MKKSPQKFVVLDAHAIIHRAWHALPPTLRTKQGELVNAVYGFTLILLKVLKDLKPDYIAVAFDLPKPTFRHEQYKAYKAQRAKQPDELYAQIPIIHEVLKAFNIPTYSCAGYEADDVIATLVRDKLVSKMQSVIVTGDMDALQLVDDNTVVYSMHKGISDTVTFDREAVKERYDGLTPEQVVDYKGLRGDPSDNIPGVRGIGEKTAIELLTEFGTIENIYKNIKSPKIKDRYRNLLLEHKDDAIMSKDLSQMIHDVPLEFNLEDTKIKNYEVAEVVKLFQRLEFKSLLAKLPKELGHGTLPGQSSMELTSATPTQTRNDADYDYTCVNDEKSFNEFLDKLKKQSSFVFDTETDGLDHVSAKVLGVSFSWKAGEAWYIVAKKEWLEKMKPILEDANIKKAGHNIKFDLHMLRNVGITVQGVWFDTMLASYLINPGSRQHNLDAVVFAELGYQMEPIDNLIGSGKNQLSMTEVPLEKLSRYSCEDADYTWRLIEPLSKQMQEKNNTKLFETIEMPLVSVLTEMERNGVMIDVEFLNTMSKQVGKKITELEKDIYKQAGTSFNVASPKQLKEILFDTLKIPTAGLGKTKTGISTAIGQLEKLQGKHPIIDLIMEYRELAKLKSTYLDALPQLVSKVDGRIHTSFNQTIAATGRLSSTDPNLQNIPIRTDIGRKIRNAFIAPKGYKIISADYSQIELRVIASLANDEKMIASFKNNEDIHTRTAAEINEVPIDQVTKEMRYAAKAINFGIIYGQGPWGLAAGAGITFQKAQEFIDRYFSIYGAIYDYLENTKKMAHELGYVETWFGRRRYVPEINSSMPAIRAQAERMAINHPIQGTAADLLKLAMISIQAKLPTVSPKSKMLLQVHDELVFEAPEKEVTKVATFVQSEMENIYKLNAPVKTEVEVGDNWGEMEELK